VVSLSEDSTALDVALRHIYPVRSPDSDKLLYASILAEFARKYQVEALDVFITIYLKDSIERDPVGVYAIAVTYGFNSIGANAAQSCLNLPFSGLLSPYLQSATAELELLKYHVACGEATSTVALSDRTWFSSLSQARIFSSSQSSMVQACGSCVMLDVIPHNSTHGSRYGPYPYGLRCLWSYLYRSAPVLAHHPTAAEVTTEAFILRTNDCSCAKSFRGDLLEVGVVLRREIEKAIKRVPLPKAVSVEASSATTGTN